MSSVSPCKLVTCVAEFCRGIFPERRVSQLPNIVMVEQSTLIQLSNIICAGSGYADCSDPSPSLICGVFVSNELPICCERTVCVCVCTCVCACACVFCLSVHMCVCVKFGSQHRHQVHTSHSDDAYMCRFSMLLLASTVKDDSLEINQHFSPTRIATTALQTWLPSNSVTKHIQAH